MDKVLAELVILAFIVVIVWINASTQSRIRERVLGTIEKAIERGVDPNSLPLSMLPARRDKYINWKTGVILIGVGLAIAPLIFLGMTVGGGDAVPVLAVPLIPIILGAFFLYIHNRLFNKDDANGNGDSAQK